MFYNDTLQKDKVLSLMFYFNVKGPSTKYNSYCCHCTEAQDERNPKVIMQLNCQELEYPNFLPLGYNWKDSNQWCMLEGSCEDPSFPCTIIMIPWNAKIHEK